MITCEICGSMVNVYTCDCCGMRYCVNCNDTPDEGGMDCPNEDCNLHPVSGMLE